MGTWVIRVGDQASGPAYRRAPSPSQPGLPGPTWWWPRRPQLPAVAPRRPGWSPVAPARPVLRRVSPPFGQAPGLLLSRTGCPGEDEPRRGWRAHSNLHTRFFCAPLLGGRRPKKSRQSVGSSVAQLCDRESVTSSLWASASSLMNRPDWHLFLEVVQRMTHLPGAALDALHRTLAHTGSSF